MSGGFPNSLVLWYDALVLRFRSSGPALPKPPAFKPFQSRAATPRRFFLKPCKLASKHMNLLRNPSCDHCVCKWGGGGGGGGGAAPHPTPPPFLAVQAYLKAYELLRNPSCDHCVCKCGGGGGLRLPQPPAFVKPCKLALKHMSFFNHHTSIVFASGAPSPPPPRFLSRASFMCECCNC